MMSEPDVIFSVCSAGFGAASVAVLLYFATSGKEPPGFRVFPITADEWVGYYFRTLILVCVLAIALGLARYIHPIVDTASVCSGFLLFANSVASWPSDRALCSIGFVVSSGSVLWTLLFPAIA